MRDGQSSISVVHVLLGLMQLDTVTIFSVPLVGGWAGTRPAPTFGAFPVGATLVVALATKGRNSQL